MSIKKTVTGLCIALFWLAVWQGIALAVGNEFFLPAPLTVVRALLNKLPTALFWKQVALSVGRVLIGFVSALAVGTLLGFLTAKINLLRTLFSPLLHFVRAAPVASFILLALVWISTDFLPAFISFLMGLPIVWEAVMQGVSRGNRELEEAALVFHLSRGKTFIAVTLPAVLPNFKAAAVTCLGFCWKSAVAAEVICLPRFAIGHALYTAKNALETADVFAYTLVTVLLSVLLEYILRKAILKREEAGRDD